jgi:hypothetical protein
MDGGGRKTMKLHMHLLGSIRHEILDDIHAFSKATHASVKMAGYSLKEDLSAQVRNAGLGSRLANTWKVKTFRNGNFKGAALAWSRAPHIIRSFDQGAVIRSSRGRWLAIPTKACPRRGADGKRITPLTFSEKIYGKLRFVQRRYGHAVLVVDEAALTSKGRLRQRKAGNRRARPKTVAMFVLLPQVTLTKRLDVKRAASVAQDRLIALLDQAAIKL